MDLLFLSSDIVDIYPEKFQAQLSKDCLLNLWSRLFSRVVQLQFRGVNEVVRMMIGWHTCLYWQLTSHQKKLLCFCLRPELISLRY